MSNDKMREEFEAEYTKAAIGWKPDLRRYEEGGDYMQPTTYWAFWGWQASRESLVVELPFVHSYPAHEASSDVDYYIDEGKHEMRGECRKAIESLGLRVKS